MIFWRIFDVNGRGEWVLPDAQKTCKEPLGRAIVLLITQSIVWSRIVYDRLAISLIAAGSDLDPP